MKVLRKHGKTDLRYWREVVYRPKLSANGSASRNLQQFYVKLQFKGRREAFPLQTNNLDEAADKAKSIYLTLVASGWEGALQEHKPRMLKETAAVNTVGEVIAAGINRSDVKKRTLADYARTLRQIVAGTLGMGSCAALRNLKEQQKWIDAVDATPLHKLKPEAIDAWRQRLLAAANSGGPVAIRHAKNTVNSMLRKAKSLFSPKFLRHLSLPAEFSNPFANINFEPRQSTRYQSQINLDSLIAAALNGDKRKKLEKLPPPELKSFLLAGLAGLRRNEIDKLEWSSFRWDENCIRLQVTDYFHPKTEESLADVAVDAELMALFKSLQDSGKGFVVESNIVPRSNAAYAHYRCERVFERLTQWLKKAGVPGGTPLHTLRKEFGSLMCSRYGIYGASRALRHRDIQVTSQHYVDSKQRLVPGLASGLLDPRGQYAEEKAY
jgi:integrase